MDNNHGRQSGILLHPTALPGPYGIGEIGHHAYKFIDHLSDMGQSLWQILPIGPTDLHNSPYSSISTFAGNHLIISLDLLVEDGLLDSECLKGNPFSNTKPIIFDEVMDFKIPILKEACRTFDLKASIEIKISFEKFCMDHSYWLDDYSQYWALKEENEQKSWINWKSKKVQNIEHVHEAKVMQFLFHDQWHRLRQYCREKEIRIIGDMPIYVGYDSADVYANRKLFQLDSSGQMIYQGGCPPCDYHKEGQLWGSPLYNWENHENTNFEWWLRRFEKLFEMVDIIRLDHFIGYAKNYRIPSKEKTAKIGEWRQAPGDKLFQILQSTIMNLNVFAEDLGDVTEEVISLRDKYNFSGMRVLQFELNQISKVEDCPNNSVVCTGTHDNDTILGWFEALPEKSSNRDTLTKNKLLQFFQCRKDSIHWEIMNYALSTTSNTVIIPLQEILGESSSARFNTPGTISSKNWSWRMEEKKLTKSLKTKLSKLTQKHERNGFAINGTLKKKLEMEKNITVAYFSAEIGISSSIPTYSGGLGVLAGDHIKAAADAKLPMVGITLLYKEGYFKQRVDEKGVQTETYPRFDSESKLKQISEKFILRLRERDIWVKAYEYSCIGEDGHTIPIYFLDTDLKENIHDDRIITLRLYSGDKDNRILQEAILGFGGIRLLEILGYKNIETYHINEGHCSFLTLSLLEKFNGDEEKVRSMCHFTTHTPVADGHDHFAVNRCRKLLQELLPENLKLPSWVQNSRLHMTELGLYFSHSANAVSKLHGLVAQNQFPDFAIDYITNGVYHPYWLGKSFHELFDIKIPGWRTNPELLLDLNNISDDELKFAHWSHKHFLLEYANSKTQKALSKDMLTIGFARRSAEYKRAKLIFLDLDRLIRLGKNKLQIIFAGKAHPKDQVGKEIIQGVVENANRLRGEVKIIFLENYNMRLGRLITSGVDVWLNTPLRPNEASGTSGMKAALNGIPNLSILDGWWAEGCKHGENGWAIGSSDKCDDKEDAESLYQLLENEVIPTFYENTGKWNQIMRNSIRTSVQFTAYKMIEEYKEKYYQIQQQEFMSIPK